MPCRCIRRCRIFTGWPSSNPAFSRLDLMPTLVDLPRLSRVKTILVCVEECMTALSFRFRLASSPKFTSKCRCIAFLMDQWAIAAFPTGSAFAYKEVMW